MMSTSDSTLQTAVMGRNGDLRPYGSRDASLNNGARDQRGGWSRKQ